MTLPKNCDVFFLFKIKICRQPAQTLKVYYRVWQRTQHRSEALMSQSIKAIIVMQKKSFIILFGCDIKLK